MGAINPDAVEGQQYGGSIMGVSRVRTEDTIYCPSTGVVLNGDLIDYKINTMLDCGPIETLIIETGMGYGPYGSVGVGEDVASVVPFAFYAAVHNAIGRKTIDFPIVNCAAMIGTSRQKVTSARICLNAVYVKPYRAFKAEEAIMGKTISEAAAEVAAIARVADAKRMSCNAYMIPVAKAMVKSAMLGCR